VLGVAEDDCLASIYTNALTAEDAEDAEENGGQKYSRVESIRWLMIIPVKFFLAGQRSATLLLTSRLLFLVLFFLCVLCVLGGESVY
jgi:hypothetical protein